jgi:hypothetical protein
VTEGTGPAPQESVQSAAQSRTPPDPGVIAAGSPSPGEGVRYDLGQRLTRGSTSRSYQREANDPLYRPLSIYALDPSLSRLGGAIAEIKLPYEPLQPGPRGAIFEVDNIDAEGIAYPKADLDEPMVLLMNGYPPSVSQPQFHQQMVYSVAMLTYANFRMALGRDVNWASGAIVDGSNRLKLRPFGALQKNAWYDRSRNEIVFGYFTAERSTPVAQEGVGKVYTGLSHDIIVHEVSHALLDGLRAHFFEPTHPDVLAFHEAFADLIAFFQHFAYPDVVRAALGQTQGRLSEATGLVSLAQEFGRGIGAEGDALRTFAELGAGKARKTFDPDVLEPHDRGQALSHAVFSAFETIYQRRARQFIKLATGGSGVLQAGDLSDTLEELLVEVARKLAQHFLEMCIRAIDYCPPVDIQFGDFLRALVTADHDLIPDDELAYRETIIRAFGERRIFPRGASSMTEDALLWSEPQTSLPTDPELRLASLRLTDDLSEPADQREIRRLAAAVGMMVSDPRFAGEFGLISPLSRDFDPNTTSIPVIESIRIARRVGPSRQLTLDLIAEVTQRMRVTRGEKTFPFYGGATIILDAAGTIRFVIRKRLDNERRQQEQWDYVNSPSAANFWREEQGRFRADPAEVQRKLCASPPGPVPR